ncbi:MAG: pyruvate dehydrogenase (acetyl-transferring), homodimeric type [Planctomycetaceae bacterium]|nr:pyruvate dehydrogenase (acetyl-transferring), homodimeric type [Planctomycetaceae bacterium]
MAAPLGSVPHDNDPQETAEWLDGLDYVIRAAGPQRAAYLLDRLRQRATSRGMSAPAAITTAYVNTIPLADQPAYPGDREIERRIKNIVRWNAMAMVVRANQQSHGIGGHISTYASAATLYEVAFNHFFHGKQGPHPPDQIFIQGHATPGIYARAFLLGRLTEDQLKNYRRELQPTPGLSSYPHPWLMPDFWEFPTVSMGLGPLMAIYQARFNHYLVDRGIKPDAAASRVWAFLGDGECDEPETLGALTLAAREQLDNLIFVVNCNLQRLDGPVRGNGKIIQELEGIFRGAGWNVIKVIWGSDWDPLLARDTDGLLVQRMNQVVDGEFQKYVVAPGDYVRKHFFDADPRLEAIFADLTDDQLHRLKRGGHDPAKVYAAYKAAIEHKGSPTVILAKTIKGYGLGEAGEGRNITHQQKKLNEDELVEFRRRFEIPISEAAARRAEFYKPPDDTPEMLYLHQRRSALSGFVPGRRAPSMKLKPPKWENFAEFFAGSDGREVSTTMAFVRLLSHLMRDRQIGRYIVPIVPDEARTFGMEALFRQFGIYSHVGQLYEPVDSDTILYYREATDGQIIEEGITEAGAMSSFIAAGSARSSQGISMIPFFVYYSMFGFQRIGDLLWAAGDMRCRGFVLGGTAGRTTLAGEGLQHQDGNSHLNALAFPNCRAYDPCYAYEMSVIVLDGLRRMFYEQQDCYYYITLMNENYAMPILPMGSTEGICRGIYKLSTRNLGPNRPNVRLFGSGAILRESLRAQELLDTHFGVSSDVFSVTSYKNLYYDGRACARWNRLHPTEPPRRTYVEQTLDGTSGPVVAALDYVAAVALSIAPWVTSSPRPLAGSEPEVDVSLRPLAGEEPEVRADVSPRPLAEEGQGARAAGVGPRYGNGAPAPATSYTVLGADGYGRSEARPELRRFFEVDAENIALAALVELAREGVYPHDKLPAAIKTLGLDPNKPNPVCV